MPTFPTRLMELLQEAVSEAFKASPMATGAVIHARLAAKVAFENSQRFEADRLALPSLRTTQRALASASAYDMTVLREGKPAADRRFKVVRRGIRTARILDRVEIDHTPLDLFVIDERTWLPLGRPILTVLIDRRSRMVLGYYLSFGAPSAAAVLGAIRHAILPKTIDTLALPTLKIEHDWPCYGLFMLLVADNGLEFHGKHLEEIALALGITLVFCPKRQPRFKGVVERFLKTVNYNFTHQIPGASFARFHQRGDYDPLKHALLTFGELKQILEKWIVDVYAETTHRGIGTTPRKAWEADLAFHTPELPADLSALKRQIGKTTMRRLQRYGIELIGNRYHSDELGLVMQQYGAGVSLRVVFDPEDLGSILVWPPHADEPLSVPAIDLAFCAGLTERQNDVIRAWAREQGIAAQDSAGLVRARAAIATQIQELALSRKVTARRRSAAIQGASSSRPDGVLTVQEVRPVPSLKKTDSPAKGNDGQLTPSESLPALLAAFVMHPSTEDDIDEH